MALSRYIRPLAYSILAGILLPTISFAQSPEARQLYDRGYQQIQKGILIDASVLFTEALAIDPEYADAYYQRGLSFLGMGREKHAIKDFTRATGLGIQQLDPYLRLIKWHTNRRQLPAALIVTDQVIAHMPENAAGGYWDKGKIYEQMNKKQLAVAAYEAALTALDSDNADFANVIKARIDVLNR